MKIIIMLFIGIAASAQVETVNCVIMIDGLLSENLCKNSIIFKDKEGVEKSINFGYEVGQLKFESIDYNILKALDPTTVITVNLGNCGFEVEIDEKSYSLKQELDNFINQRYLILRIFNCRNSDEYKVFAESPKYHNPLPKIKNRNKLIKCR